MRSKIKKVYQKDKDAYGYLSVVFLGYAIYECFSRIALTYENNMNTWNFHYAYSVVFAAFGVFLSAFFLKKLYDYANVIARYKKLLTR